jgi:hypothetical protein
MFNATGTTSMQGHELFVDFKFIDHYNFPLSSS